METMDESKIFGLDNIRNTCYINSTLQCLFTYPEFRDSINDIQHSKKNISGSLQHILKDPNKTSGIKILLKNLIQKVDWFKFLQHNDINEFINIFFNQLNMEIYSFDKLDIRPYKPTTSPRISKFIAKANNEWFKFVKNENTWFNELCTGQVVNQIICGHCGKIHHNFETFRMLDVEIPTTEKSESISVTDCLAKYFDKHYINCDDDDDGDKWKCDKCNHKKKSLKSCKIVRSPQMFIISLKRFKMVTHTRGGNTEYRFAKNNAHVYVSDDININDFSINNEVEFELNAIANHMGGTDGGHYNAFCKHGNDWYLIDDETVRKTKAYNDQSAYILFYSKK